ncbi:MAG: type-F conjugative transfer system protein TraW [Gammaproteobacteria bacterium]
MKRKMTIKNYLLLIMWIVISSFSVFSHARNVGTIGQIYSINEEDFLEFIEARVLLMQQNGALSNLKKNMQHQAESYRDRPKPVEGITHTDVAKNWLFDPSIVLDHDVLTPDGKIIAKNGTRVNPLTYVALKRTLIFYDADDKKEIEWISQLDKKIKGNDKLILVKGSVLQEEKRLSKQIYFDQSGHLTTRFGITHVPAVVVQEGNLLRIREVKP